MVADAIEGAPVVDRLDTRFIEQRRVLRGFVRRAELIGADAATEPGRLDLRTEDRWSTDWTSWGAAERRDRPSSAGLLRVEVVADDVVRVRYQPGVETFDDNNDVDSAMVVGAFETPDVTCDGTTLRTETMSVAVGLDPVSITVRSADGVERCRVGGREKNQWSQWDGYSTGVSRTVDGDRPLATECYALRPGEAVYGFGEQFTRMERRGQTIDLNMVEAVGTTTPRAYKNIPFYWTSAGYGVFWNTSARTTVWVGSRAAADVQVAMEDDHLDQFIFVGEPKAILGRYTQLTGRAHQPPAWSFGWWQSKISYRSAGEVLDVVHRHRQAGLPLDVIHLDTHWFREDWRNDLEFAPDRFPDPEAFLAELADQGVHVCLWQLPYIPEGSDLFDELAAADGFVRTADGTAMYDVRICYTPGFTGQVGIVDFTNPAAVEVYRKHLARLHALGVAAIKVDFGEQAPLDGTYHDGTPGHLAHNRYPLRYNQAIAEATHSATGEWIIWARSAWAGSQRYPLHWGGDSSPNWDNLGPQFSAGLSLGLSGFTFWSQDIGGFLSNTGGELLIRWLQAGLFTSHTRIHGVGNRELADHGGDVLRIGRDLLELRYRLLPTILGEARRSAKAGLPMMRALVVEFPDDPSTWPIDDQWLFGANLLVAPIFDPSGRRRVYLPAGRWADWWTGEVVEGGRWIRVEAPIDRIPLWIREGGAVALGPMMAHVGQRRTDELVVRGVAPTDGPGGAGAFQADGATIAWHWAGQEIVVDTPADVTVTVEVLGAG